METLKKKYKSKSYRQKYTSKWQNDPILKHWVESLGTNLTRVKCRFCHVNLRAHKADLLKHGKTAKHKEAEKILGIQIRSIESCIMTDETRRRKINELKIAFYIAETSSLRNADAVVGLIRNLRPSIGKDESVFSDVQMHRTKCTALINNVLAPYFHEELVKDIKLSNYGFSLILDESTDISDIKWMGMIIRYYSKEKNAIIDTLFRMYPLESGTAHSLATAIIDALENEGLNLQKLIGIGIDGANVNVGQYHSISSILKEKVPGLVTVKCICHSLHLAANYASKKLPDHIDMLVKNTYAWFSNSSKRQNAYGEVIKQFDSVKALKILRVCDTRWLSLYCAVDRIADQWDCLLQYFKTEMESRTAGSQVKQLYSLYSNGVNRAYINFLRYILKEVHRVNILFQLENPDVSVLFSNLLTFYHFLLKIIVTPSQLEKCNNSNLFHFEFDKYLMPTSCIYFGFDFQRCVDQYKLPDNDKNYLRERCKAFLVELTGQVKGRLPENIAIFEKLTILSPTKALNPLQPNICDLAAAFPNLCSSVDACQAQWKQLSFVDKVNFDLEHDLVSFWASVEKIQDASSCTMFPDLVQLALGLLSLPFSNATVERLFSMMNNVKSKLRNRLALQTTESLVRIRYAKKLKGINSEIFEPNDCMLKDFTNEMYKNANSYFNHHDDTFPLTDEIINTSN